jgi:hypothetical protein
MRLVTSVSLVALLAMGCSGADAFLGPGNIDGRWGESFSVPGNSFSMNLSSNGSVVSGSGNYCGEAGPCGTLTVAGTIVGIVVHLDLTFTQQVPRLEPGMVEHFDGRFTSANVLEGSIVTDTPGQIPGRTSYRRE